MYWQRVNKQVKGTGYIDQKQIHAFMKMTEGAVQISRK